jgi:hypothetical protein
MSVRKSTMFTRESVKGILLDRTTSDSL